ncbi:MAG: TetR family transcriptional regulator [Gordonia sp. (in: high G+C Gram-positive bacteria)]|uniref:TetR/AcrR family transcriptional regulator n=1 Tax=Gordonia sp. (in: high G+C Gram-positive bacteria) TaxID=84139 RepID=UPI0039E3F6FE
MTTTGGRKRGRPARSADRAPLTKESIAEAGLRIAGDEGFPQLTMRRLAAELDVTVRALYNVVADRQEVVDLTAARMVENLPDHDYDARDWRRSVRRMYREARAAYRAFPRATLVSLDETITPTEVPERRILSPNGSSPSWSTSDSPSTTRSPSAVSSSSRSSASSC